MARTSNTADRRAQIVDAAIAVMATHGYDGASVADIARKAKLAPGLVHYHFDSKLEILVEVVRAIGVRHATALDARLGPEPESAPSPPATHHRDNHTSASAATRVVSARVLHAKDAPAQLVAFIDLHLGLGKHADAELLACWVLVTAEALREKRVRIEVERVFARLVARVTAIIESGNASNSCTCADPRAAAAALVATIHGYFAVAATARQVVPLGSAAVCTKQMMGALVGAPLGRKKR